MVVTLIWFATFCPFSFPYTHPHPTGGRMYMYSVGDKCFEWLPHFSLLEEVGGVQVCSRV